MPEHWRYPFLPTASAILEDVNLESLLEDYFYAEARALAINRLETSATRGIIDIEGPPTNDENDIVLGYVISRLVLAATDNQALVNYVALSEAIRAEAHLSSETDEDLVDFVNKLGAVQVKLNNSKFDMSFIDYVRAASKLREAIGNYRIEASVTGLYL